MRSPLSKRFPREIRHNLARYVAMLLILVLGVGMGNGCFQAAENSLAIMNGMRDAYNIEDGRFATFFGATQEALDEIESSTDSTVYENFSLDLDLAIPGRDASDEDATITARLYENRTDVNLAAYAQGRAPESDNEIALDRVFMLNNDLAVGDVVTVAGREFTTCGIMTLPDYQALYESNSDAVHNALTFTVAQVTHEAFSSMVDEGESFTYSFVFDDRDLTTAERTTLEEQIIDILVDHDLAVSDFSDYEYNQGISYVINDIGGDRGTFMALTSLITIVLAFVFVMLTSATIEQESPVIGTLLAMGYRKGELIRHYMALPLLVGVVGCILGDLFGGLVTEGFMRESYYGTYSLPPYVRQPNIHVYLITTVLPLVLLALITFIGLARKMHFTPLQFLRGEAARGKRSKGIRLPEGLGYVNRFRARVFFRNISNIVVMFVGITVANLLLLFGLCMLPMMDSYSQTLKDEMVAGHIYTLKDALEIEATDEEREAFAAAEDLITTDPDTISFNISTLRNVKLAQSVDMDAHPVNRYAVSDEQIAQAEKIAVMQLEVSRSFGDNPETITVYGIQENSRYWTDIDVTGGRIVADGGLIEKCEVGIGSPGEFVDKTTDTTYTITPDARTGSVASTSLYMSIDTFNELFGNEADYFNGYASDMELDLDPLFVVSDLTPSDMDKIAAQMRSTFGDMMTMIMAISIPIYLVVIFLLTKTVIDRSARSISYMKVFGYHNPEVNGLYVRPITVAVVISLILSLPVVAALMSVVAKVVFSTMSGNFPIAIPPSRMLIDVAIGLVAYLVIVLLHVRHIRKVPLSLALKVQE